MHRVDLRLLLVASLLAGCGGSTESTRPARAFEGRADAPPSMEVLPDDEGEGSGSAHMRAGWSLAEEAFEVPSPEPPAGHDAATLDAWSNGPLRRWLAQKSRRVDEARRELDAAAEETHPQRVMGGAIVGLMYEDIVRVLREIPTPTELLEEPEIADAYQDVVEFQASTYLEQARRAYRACAANAEQLEEMERWRRFCSRRRNALPAGRSAPTPPAAAMSDDPDEPDEPTSPPPSPAGQPTPSSSSTPDEG